MPPRDPPEEFRRGLALLALLVVTIVGPAARARAQAAAASPGAMAASADSSRGLAVTDSVAASPNAAAPDSGGPSPFPRLTLAAQPAGRYAWSYAAMGTGVALIGVSFLFGHRANDTYDAYLRETDPGQIERLFDRTVWLDRGSSGSLLLGEGLLCVGLWGRFLHRSPSQTAWRLEPGRCAVSHRF